MSRESVSHVGGPTPSTHWWRRISYKISQGLDDRLAGRRAQARPCKRDFVMMSVHSQDVIASSSINIEHWWLLQSSRRDRTPVRPRYITATSKHTQCHLRHRHVREVNCQLYIQYFDISCAPVVIRIPRLGSYCPSLALCLQRYNVLVTPRVHSSVNDSVCYTTDRRWPWNKCAGVYVYLAHLS